MSSTVPDIDEQRVTEFITAIRSGVAPVVVGQDVVVERTLIPLFRGGRLLLQGVPGLAGTLRVSVLSRSIDLSFARIQFAIDLLLLEQFTKTYRRFWLSGYGPQRPKHLRRGHKSALNAVDIPGAEILDQRTIEFHAKKNLFTNLLLVDEINRAAPGAVFEKSWRVVARGSHGIRALHPPPQPQIRVIRCKVNSKTSLSSVGKIDRRCNPGVKFNRNELESSQIRTPCLW